MSYVLAVVTKLNQTEKAVKVKARGKAINRAVDVVEIVRNKFIKDVKIQGIELSTEEVKTEDGNTLRVSSMEVTLTK
jgi:archaea-specific DNA-binding protein